MKKFLFLTGLVMAAVLIIYCNGNAKTPATVLDDGSTKIVKINGKPVKVNAFTAMHYDEDEIAEALVRERYTCQLPKITNASGLGRKKAEVVWRAFAPHQTNTMLTEYGNVTVTYYERGIQITKDGKSWFYENIIYEGLHSLAHITSVESVLHPGIWEPAYLKVAPGSRPDIEFHFLYKGKCKEDHWILLMAFQAKKFGINSISDLQISVKEY